MTTTESSTPEDVLHAIAELLDKYRDQNRRHADAANAEAALCPITHEQAVLPLYAVDDAQAEEDTAPAPKAATDLEIRSSPGPWEDLTGVLPKGLNLPMSPALYAKMLWITNNVPKMSLQKIAKAGAEAEADRLIALHYKPSSI